MMARAAAAVAQHAMARVVFALFAEILFFRDVQAVVFSVVMTLLREW